MQDIRKVFEDRDTDNSGSIDISEMSAAMKALQVNLSADEVKSLFKVSLEPVSRLAMFLTFLCRPVAAFEPNSYASG